MDQDIHATETNDCTVCGVITISTDKVKLSFSGTLRTDAVSKATHADQA